MRRIKLLDQLLLLCSCYLCRADPPTFNRSAKFDTGSLGYYVELSFNSSDLVAPQLNIQQWSDECNSDDSYYFFAPRGLMVGRTGPTILDSHGHLVWRREDYGMTYDFKVQKYKGQDVLTFWSGDDAVVGHGSGFQYIVSRQCFNRLPVILVANLGLHKSLTPHIARSQSSDHTAT